MEVIDKRPVPTTFFDAFCFGELAGYLYLDKNVSYSALIWNVSTGEEVVLTSAMPPVCFLSI
jgi:hypothetical protein